MPQQPPNPRQPGPTHAQQVGRQLFREIDRNMPRRRKKDVPAELGDDLIQQCRAFMAVKVPESNIVFVEDFDKYMPLFNKEMNERMSRDAANELYQEYNATFSPQHPILILEHIRDKNGVYHPQLRDSYRLVRKVPARIRRVGTLNDLGPKVPMLINAFFNATASPSGPYDTRKAQYARAIAKAISEVDTKSNTAKADREEFAKEEAALLRQQVPGQPQAQAKDETPEGSSTVSEGLISWD